MPIIHAHDLKKFLPSKRLAKEGQGLTISRSYKQPYIGNGIIDIIKSGVEFVKNNPELIKGAIQTVGNIKNMTSDISKALESSNRLKELRAIKEIAKTTTKPLSPEVTEKIREISGNGFKRF
jgi:hypothetical protein